MGVWPRPARMSTFHATITVLCWINPSGCAYIGTLWHSTVQTTFSAFLLLFMHKMCKSEAPQGYPCRALTLGAVPQYHPHAAVLQLNKERLPSRYFLRAADHRSFLFPDQHSKSILSNHSFWPDYQAQQSLSCHFSLFACLLPMKNLPCKTHFSLWHLLKTGSCVKSCHSETKGRKYVCRSCLLYFNSPDLTQSNSDSQLMNSFPLYLCVPVSESRKQCVLTLLKLLKLW
jgi:hypothetical protein